MGFVLAQERLGPGRIHHCMRWLGMAQRAFELDVPLRDRARGVRQHARPQGEHPGLGRRESRADIQAARLMTLHAAWTIDTAGRQRGARGDRADQVLRRARACTTVVDRAIQVFGAAGVTEDHPLSMFYRQARLARIYDGPDEVHKMTVARRILARYEPKR